MRFSAFPSVVRSLIPAFCSVLVGAGMLAATAWAANESKQVSGTVSAIERKGATAKLTIEPFDGEKIDVFWSKASPYQVEAKANDKFFRPGVWVTTTASKQGQNWYSSDFQVHVKAKMTPGALKHPTGGAHDIVGTLTAYDKSSVTLSVGPLGLIRILLDDKALDNIKVYTGNSEFVEVGCSVEMEGVARGKKFIPSRMVVKLEKPITAEQVFSKKKLDLVKPDPITAVPDGDPKAKGKAAPRGKKPAAGQNLPNPDPFGALGGDAAPAKGKKAKK